MTHKESSTTFTPLGEFHTQLHSSTMRESQVSAFQCIVNSGMLSRMRMLVYQEIHASYLQGTSLTSGEIDRILSKKLDTWTRAASPRLNELVKLGVIQELGKRACTSTGMTVLHYTVVPGSFPNESPVPVKDLEEESGTHMEELYCNAKVFEHKDDWYVEIEVDDVLLRKKHDSKLLAEATIEQLPRLGPTFFEHLEDWYKWKPIDKETDKMHKLFGIKKTIDPLKCAAMRCKEEKEKYLDGAAWELPGMSLPICTKHLKEAGENDSAPDTGNAAMVKATIAEVDDALETAEALEIETQEDLDDVQTWLVEVKGMLNKVLEAKEAVLVPLRALTNDARDVFKPAEHKLQALESVLKGKLIEAKKRMQGDNQEALDEGAEATAKGEKNNGVSKLKEFGGVKGVSTSSKWKWKLSGEIVDVEEDYLDLVVNKKALDALCTGVKEKPAEVQGIEFYEDIGVSVRA